MTAIAERLGVRLADVLLELGDQAASVGMAWKDVLVLPVPMHAAKQKQRGFNHAELLARSAAKSLHARRSEWNPRLRIGMLERRRATASQSGLTPHQRRANLRGVFFVPRPEQVAGRQVLLIDDIYTTGATARACSQALRRAGAASVWVATVARPQRETFAAPQFVQIADDEELPMQDDVAFWDSKQEGFQLGK
ncbi:ComF family protein [Acidisarcina polymorpha]|nr:phosphoribosyltransferase family protein [Acidisarcina polymorpha]